MSDHNRLSTVQSSGDPLSGLIRLLRPRTTLWARIEAYGRWGVHFRQRNDLLFCWVESGECMLLRPGAEPQLLRDLDFTFVRTSTPFTLASDCAAPVIDSDELVATSGLSRMTIGEEGTQGATVIRGGRFFFDAANEALLMDMLPPVMTLNAGDQRASGHLRELLLMSEEESRSQWMGRQLFVENLMELILLEALRRVAIDIGPERKGLLAGLADPKLALAIAAMHDEPSRQWSTMSLARLCGLSRSGFADRFGSVMGTGAIAYLQNWRIALAKDALRWSASTIGEIGLAVGFQSSSAFSTAFSRIAGCSPKQFRERL